MLGNTIGKAWESGFDCCMKWGLEWNGANCCRGVSLAEVKLVATGNGIRMEWLDVPGEKIRMERCQLIKGRLVSVFRHFSPWKALMCTVSGYFNVLFDCMCLFFGNDFYCLFDVYFNRGYNIFFLGGLVERSLTHRGGQGAREQASLLEGGFGIFRQCLSSLLSLLVWSKQEWPTWRIPGKNDQEDSKFTAVEICWKEQIENLQALETKEICVQGAC